MTETTAPLSVTSHAAVDQAPPAKLTSQNRGRAGDRIESIHVSKIKVVSNVRVAPFDKKALEALAATIRNDGQLEPAQVRALDDGTYALTFGHRRHAAVALNEAKHGGDGMLCCVVNNSISVDDIPFIQLVENLQREDMKEYDAAVTLHALQQQHKWTAKQVADRIGFSERQTRTYLVVGGAPDWLRQSLNGVEIQVKVKGDDGTPSFAEDGSPISEARTLPGLSLDKVYLLVKYHQDLTSSERDFVGVPGYKPRADKLTRAMVHQAAAHSLSRADLAARIDSAAAKRLGLEAPDAEATVLRAPKKRPYSISPRSIHIDVARLGDLSVAERRAMAAELHAALVALGPDFFTSVELKGP